MVYVPILALLIIALFIAGVVFIFKAYRNVPDGKKAIPIEEFENVNEALQSAKKNEDELKLQLDSVSVQLDETKGKLVQSASVEKELAASKNKESQTQGQIEKLEKNLHFISNKADAQAQKAIAAISALNDKNKMLKEGSVNADSVISPEELEQWKMEKQNLEQIIQDNIDKRQSLEAELNEARKQSEETSPEAQLKIDDLKNENNKLRDAIGSITAKIDDVETGFKKVKESENQMKVDNQAKEAQLKEAHKSIEELEGSMTTLKNQIDQNESSIAQIEGQSLNASGPGSTNSGDFSLLSTESDSQTILKKLKEENILLIEKEKILQAELTKAQTQSLGLEKICEDFKNQLDGQN